VYLYVGEFLSPFEGDPFVLHSKVLDNVIG
jgi:hypothetical protein